jgi:hypothetical protein
MTTFLSNREIYERVIRETVPLARERLWIATADIKDMYVDVGGRDMVPFLEVLDGMLKRGVDPSRRNNLGLCWNDVARHVVRPEV